MSDPVTVDYPSHLTSDRLRAQEAGDPPLVAGGQGRTDREVDRRGEWLITVALMAAVLAIVGATMALAYWAGTRR